MLPTLLGLAGPIYFGASILLGSACWPRPSASRDRPRLADARRVMFASLLYLPVAVRDHGGRQAADAPW
jgi:hypothetical protein